jgi:PAS domain-containing protein
MAPTLVDLFRQIAQQAALYNAPFLAHICRMAAVEAHGKDIPVPLASMTIVGMWDWDAVNDINHLDEGCAELFGVDPAQARLGMSINDYLRAVHPEDAQRLGDAIMRTLKLGGPIEIRYRIISNGRVRHVLARGICTLDKAGRAQRFPGVILEIPASAS